MTSLPSTGSPHPGSTITAFAARKRRADSESLTTGRKKKKALDKHLPQQIKAYVPESALFNELTALEKRIDATLMRKRVEVHAALKQPAKSTRTVRIFLTSKETTADVTDDPGWLLRVEGRLLDEAVFSSKARRRFSSFFSKIFLEFQGPQGEKDIIVEWEKPVEGGDVDGFEVKRAGPRPTKCRIFLAPDSQPTVYQLAPSLAQLLGGGPQPRHAVIQSLWAYIKANQLQDKDDKTLINCNQALQEVFGCTAMPFHTLPDRLGPLLLPLPPLELTCALGDESLCYDVDVEIDDVSARQQLQTFMLQPQDLKDLQEADNQILLLLRKIDSHAHKYEFMKQFTDDPVAFIHKWIGSQHSDLQVMQDGPGNVEEQRRADYYQKAWVEEASWKYLADKTLQQRIELERQLQLLKST